MEKDGVSPHVNRRILIESDPEEEHRRPEAGEREHEVHSKCSYSQKDQREARNDEDYDLRFEREGWEVGREPARKIADREIHRDLAPRA